MEVLPHHAGSLSGGPQRGTAGNIALVHLPLCATLSVVCSKPSTVPCPGLTVASGECATHFQKHLKQYPPQVSSRNAAAGWGCFIHNEVNSMLNKPEFDCNNIGDFYDCGCEEEEAPETGKGSKSQSKDQRGGHDGDTSPPVEISKEP